MSETLVPPSPEPQNLDDDAWTQDERLLNPEGLRRRRKRRVTGFAIDSDCEPEYEEYDASGSDASCSERSLPCYVEHEPSGSQEGVPTLSNVALSLSFSSPGYNDAQRAREATTIPSQTLPMHIGETNNTSVQDSPSRIAQVFANVSGLYRQLCEADDEGNTDEFLLRKIRFRCLERCRDVVWSFL